MKLLGADSAAFSSTVISGAWRLLEQYAHLLRLFFLRSLLRTINTSSYLRSSVCYVALAAILAELEKPEVPGGGGHLASPSDGKRAALLPPRAEGDRERLTIVLDLDETLVCAYNAAGLLPGVHNCAVAGGIRWFTIQCVAVAPTKDGEGSARITNVVVYERPGLHEFLSRAADLGELVLFTAGLEGYARPLVDRIDTAGRFSARLYRPATVRTHFREHVKDLSNLGRDLAHTVIVDNNPFSFLLQPRNGIPCVPFTGEATEDRQLLDVLLPLLEQLSSSPDVRPVLLDRFHMPTWFRNRGFPVS